MNRELFKFASFVVVAGCLAAGCATKREAVVVPHSHAVVVTRAHPAPKQEVIGTEPGDAYVWVPGYWTFGEDRWVWIPGHWQEHQYLGAGLTRSP